MHRLAAWTMVVVLGAVTAGCASFRQGARLSLSTDAPSAERSKPPTPSISIALDVRTVTNGRAHAVKAESLAPWADATVAAYRDSGFFANVTYGSDAPADVHARVRVTEWREVNPVTLLFTTLSLSLFPTTVRTTLQVETEIGPGDGARGSTFRRDEIIHSWIQLAMLALASERSPGDVRRVVLYDLSAGIVADAGAAHIF